jgi:hypothetical protein
MMVKVQKHNSFNTNTPLSESYRNHYVNVDKVCLNTHIFIIKEDSRHSGYINLPSASSLGCNTTPNFFFSPSHFIYMLAYAWVWIHVFFSFYS